MMTADLIFVRGKGTVSEIIETVSHSPYSHVAGVVDDSTLIEAQGFRRVGYQSLSYYANEFDVYTCYFATDNQRNQIMNFVKQQIGKPYSYWLIVWEFFRYTAHIAVPVWEHQPLICSTLWADAYRSVGINLAPGIKYPSPADLAKSPLLRRME